MNFKALLTSKSKQDLLIMILATAVGSGFTLLSQLLLSTFLAPDTFGEIRLIYGYFLILVPMVMMAAHAPLGRLCIKKGAQKRWKLYWRTMLRWWRMPAAFVTTLFCAAALGGLLLQNNYLSHPLAILLLAMPVWVMLELYQYFWKYTRERRKSSLALVLGRVGLMGGGFIGAWITKSAEGFALGFLGGGLLTWAVLYLIQKPFLQTLPQEEELLTQEERHIVWKFLPTSFAVFMLGTLALQMDMIFLDHMNINTTTIGLYAFALMFANMPLLFQAPLSAYLLPEFGQLYDENKPLFFKRLFISQMLMTGLIACVSLTLYLLLPVILKIFFNPDYLPALAFLAPLLGRIVMQSAFGILAQGLFVLHAMKLTVLLNILWVTTGAILSYLWLQEYGVLGLIYAKIVSDVFMMALHAASLLYFMKKS